MGGSKSLRIGLKPVVMGIGSTASDLSLETTDNPGWWASFQLYTTEAEANSILADSLHRKDVDVSVKTGTSAYIPNRCRRALKHVH